MQQSFQVLGDGHSERARMEAVGGQTRERTSTADKNQFIIIAHRRHKHKHRRLHLFVCRWPDFAVGLQIVLMLVVVVAALDVVDDYDIKPVASYQANPFI